MTNEEAFPIVNTEAEVDAYMKKIMAEGESMLYLKDVDALLISTAEAQRAETLRNIVVFLHDLSKWNVIIYPIIEQIDELLRTELRNATIDIELKR